MQFCRCEAVEDAEINVNGRVIPEQSKRLFRERLVADGKSVAGMDEDEPQLAIAGQDRSKQSRIAQLAIKIRAAIRI